MAAKKKTAAKKTGAKKTAAKKTGTKKKASKRDATKRTSRKRRGSAGLIVTAPSSAPKRKASAKRATKRRQGGQAANMNLPAGQRLVGVHAHRGKTIALVRRGGRVSAYLTGDPSAGRMAAADMLAIGEPRRSPAAALDDARQHIDRVLAGMARPQS